MTRYRASPNLRRVAAGDHLVVVDTGTGATHVLDAAGGRLIDELHSWRSARDLAAAHLGPEVPDEELAGLAAVIGATLEELRTIRLVEHR